MLQSPEIAFETDLKGNNLSKIEANLKESTRSGKKEASQPPDSKAGKKLQVDDFLVSGGKVNVSVTALGGKSTTVNLPEIHLQSLGTGAEGITAAELTEKILQEIVQKATEAAASQLATGRLNLTNALPKSIGDAEKLSRGIGDLLKPKN
jgi:hypothetical protein